MLWPLSGDDLDGEFPFNGDSYNNVERVIWSKPDVRAVLDQRGTRASAGGAAFALAVTGQVTEVAGKKTKASCFRAAAPAAPAAAPGAATAPAEAPGTPRRRHHRSRHLHRLSLRLPRLPRCQLQR